MARYCVGLPDSLHGQHILCIYGAKRLMVRKWLQTRCGAQLSAVSLWRQKVVH